jgi:ankyrin repeat protein
VTQNKEPIFAANFVLGKSKKQIQFVDLYSILNSITDPLHSFLPLPNLEDISFLRDIGLMVDSSTGRKPHLMSRKMRFLKMKATAIKQA